MGVELVQRVELNPATWAAPEAMHAEEYARSLTTLRILGNIAVNNPEVNSRHEAAQEGWRDFLSATEENLATDPEFGEKLIFNPMRKHKYLDGHTTDSLGRKVSDLITNGIDAARKAARTDPEMRIQLERDEGDLELIQIVDSLSIGEMYAAVSVEPKSALRRRPEYWRDKGYREGMAVAQVYFRSTEDELLAGAYSIKQSSLPAIRRVIAKHGTHIPENESENRYIRHGIRKFMSPEEARTFGDSLRQSHAEELGNANEVISVTELLAENEYLVRSYFDTYIIPLTSANAAGRSDPNVQALARAMLGNSSKYSSEEIHSLMRLANGRVPNNTDTLFLEGKIRYALVEELRKYIPFYLKPAHTGRHSPQIPHQPYQYIPQNPVIGAEMHTKIAGNITNGLEAGRSYGGCASAGGAGADGAGSTFEMLGGPQDIFGGNGNLLDDKYGTRIFICPKNGCKNERPKDKLIPRCQKCGADVSCGNTKDERVKSKVIQLKPKIAAKKMTLFSVAA